MSKQRKRGLTRREFAKLTGAGAAAAGLGANFLFPARAAAQQKTLKIVQWSHFVPGYDKWFDNTYTKEWGAKNDTNVIVDHIAIGEINARAAAEVAAEEGARPLHVPRRRRRRTRSRSSTTARSTQEVEKKHGKKIDLAHKSTFNPKTKKYFAFSDSYVPDPGNYRKDLWAKVGFPNGPDTWDDLRVGGKKIKDQFGNPVGLGLSQELDTNMAMRALLWSFGGAEQDENGNVDDQLEEDDRGDEVHEGALQGVRDARRSSPGTRRRTTAASSPASCPSSATRSRSPARPRRTTRRCPRRSWWRRRSRARCAGSPPSTSWTATWSGTSPRTRKARSSSSSTTSTTSAPRSRPASSTTSPASRATVPDLKAQLANDPKAVPPDKYKVLGNVARLGDQRRLPGLRDGRDRRGLQHVRPPDDVRQGGARRRHARGRDEGRGEGDPAHLRQVEVRGGLLREWRSSRRGGSPRSSSKGHARRRRRRRPREPRGRVPRPPRPVRLGQDDAPAHDRGARGADLRRDPDRRRGRQRPDAARAPDRDGLPELRALSAPDACSGTSPFR